MRVGCILLVAGVAFALFGRGISLAQARATPTPITRTTTRPKPTTHPKLITDSGFVRAYYFTRRNPKPPASGSTANQASFTPAIALHAAYQMGSGLSLAGAYLYANPFNNCVGAISRLKLPCGKHPIVPAGVNQQNNPDDTLPGYSMSALYEAYLQYRGVNTFVRLGDQMIDTPWANASDSRLKPVAFRGIDTSYQINKNWMLEAMYISRWEDRVQSSFTDSTILTQNASYPDANGVDNTGIPQGGSIATNGFYYGRVGYTNGQIHINVHDYGFDQIVRAVWVDAKYEWRRSARPFIALQGGVESSAGAAYAGKINSKVLGIQGGIDPWKNVVFMIGADVIPVESESITLPVGASCSGAHEIKGTLMYFIPTGGTPNCVPGVVPGTATVYFGGWASPYTDSYATDPFFSTSISQGMVDRRSPGSGVKLSGVYYTDAKRLRLILSHAWYVYGYGSGGLSSTEETDIDATYYFRKPLEGRYHGLLLRHRFANRTQSLTGLYGGDPEFSYNRTQLEYDF